MKLIRLIFFSILTFFIIATVIAFFIPSRIQVLRMVYLPLGNDTVLNKVKDLSQWKKWYPGLDKIELKNTKSQHGIITKAIAANVLLDVKTVTDSSVTVQMQKGEKPVTAIWQINKDERNDSLALQNIMTVDLKWYPWEKFSSLLLDKNYGDRMQKALNNLKQL